MQTKLSNTEVRTIKQALQSGFDSIAKIKRNYGETKSRALVVDLVVEFVQFVNVGKTMNANQVAETTKLIESYFPHLNLADLKLFFNQMKLGHFGKFYDRIDGQIILEKLDEYNQERMNIVEGLNNDYHKQIKKQDNFQIASYHPNVIQAITKTIDDVKKKKLSTTTQNIDNQKERSQFESQDLSQKWFKQFDNLYLKFGETTSGIRFLIFGNKRYTQETFIERKFNNYLNNQS